MSTNRDPNTLLDLLTDAWVSADADFVNGALSVLSAERQARSTFKLVELPPYSAELDRRVRVAGMVKTALKKRAVSEYEDIVATDVNTWYPSGASISADSAGDLAPMDFKLTDGQELAWTKLVKWLNNDEEPFFVLKGYAGTGKSLLMKKLHALTRWNLYFSAPTNKATKVLSDFIGEQCRTTYSILGLRMVEEDDQQVLSSAKPIDLGSCPILVIDEAGMIPEFMANILRELCDVKGWRVIFVGDPAQLNPVSEPRSIIWSFAPKEYRALLTEVKRFDNQLLALSVEIRNRLKSKSYGSSPILDDNDGTKGVFVMGRRKMMDRIASLSIDDWKTTKVGCWRNKTVAQYTDFIRKRLGFKEEYEPNDLIMMASPMTDSYKRVIAFTDEEFQIKAIEERMIELPEGRIEAREMTLKDSKLTLLVPYDYPAFNEILARRAGLASKADGAERKLLWSRFWNLKNQFQSVRHGYCLTAHRLQGSTLDHIFVDQSDVLANRNEREAYRCLYVLATRPRHSLITF